MPSFLKSAKPVSPSDLALAKEFARRLAAQVDPRVFRVTLFGPRARDDADEEADLDLFVTLFANFSLKKSRG